MSCIYLRNYCDTFDVPLFYKNIKYRFLCISICIYIYLECMLTYNEYKL